MDAEDWRQAAAHFQQVKTGTDAVIQDAALRLADCYYMQKSWNQALDIYNNAISKHSNGADYATFQKSHDFGGTKPQHRKNWLHAEH